MRKKELIDRIVKLELLLLGLEARVEKLSREMDDAMEEMSRDPSALLQSGIDSIMGYSVKGARKTAGRGDKK